MSSLGSANEIVPWEEERIFHDGPSFIASLKKAIRSAQSSIDMETYIFRPDSLGRPLLRELVEAARRGVRVRLLIDGVGSISWTSREVEELKKHGVAIRFYHPLPWQMRIWRLTQIFHLRRIRRALKLLNRRNHRKTCIIDRRHAYVGGMNIHSAHLLWRDTSVKVTGAEVRFLFQAFEQAWFPKRVARRKKLIRARAKLIRLNFRWTERRRNFRSLIRRIMRADRRVWITSPYFVPDVALLKALRYASWRGVDAKLLVPKNNDIFFMKWVNRAFYSILLSSGVEVYEYRDRMMHAKVLLIDDWATVGSSNMNQRSLLHDLEVDVVLCSRESIADLESQFTRDLRDCVKIQAQRWLRRSWLYHLLGGILLKFRFWL